MTQTELHECPQCRGLMVMNKDKRYWKCKCGNAILIKKQGIEKRYIESIENKQTTTKKEMEEK